LYRAKQIAEALVLSGFITPFKEDVKHLNAAEPEHYVQDNELLVPVAKNVSELGTTSVWSVVEGAVYAGSMKRKAGLIGQFTDGKDVYVVLNERTKKAYLFESDIAREPIAEMRIDSVNVDFDHEHFEFGVRVAPNSADAKDKPELFNAGTKQVQTEFGNAWFSLGAQHPKSDISRLVKADARGGIVGSETAQNAKTSQMAASEPQEVRRADLAAPEAPSQHQNHDFATHGAPSDAAATPMTGREYHSQAQPERGERNPLDNYAAVPQHEPDQQSTASENPSLGAPYYGAAQPQQQQQQQGQGYGAYQASPSKVPYEVAGGMSKHGNSDHHSMGDEGLSHGTSASSSGGTAPMSKTHLDNYFRAQEDPSFDSTATRSTFPSGNRDDMSRAGHVADVAAAKVANFVTSHHHPTASGGQGSAAPSNPSKFQQHSTGAYGAHAAP
jgi:hypothetical protein